MSRRTKFSIASLAAATALVLLAIVSSALAGNVDDKTITAPQLDPRDDCNLPTSTQALLSQGDQDSYFLAPGGNFSDSSANWYFDGGAGLTTVTNTDGSSNGVLQIPAGGQAVSPVICVTVDCPHAKIFARNLNGGGDRLKFGVSYYRDGAWSSWKRTADFKGNDKNWGLSDKLNIQPEKKDGFQQVRFAIYNDTKDKTFQLDDFWIDPRASR
jgi:hypothetical protein